MASLIRRLLIGGPLALLPGTVLRAQPLDQPSLSYDYVAQSESLRDVLANSGADYDVSVIVSDKVNDRTNGRFGPENLQAFLQSMVSLYSLGWYYDGTTLYVFKTTEMQSRLMRLEQVGEVKLKRALTTAGIREPRFGWRIDPSGWLVHMSDPGCYLELVEQTAQVLEQQYILRNEEISDLGMETFPLHYVVIENRKIKYRDDEIEAPGIASILSRVLSDTNVVAVDDEPDKLHPGPQSSHAVVWTKPSLSVVMVRDHRDRLPMYRCLIEALDRPSARIEVGLSVIDINTENFVQLGVDWSTGIRLDNNKSIQICTTGQDNEEGDDVGNGAVGNLADSRGLDFLLARVTLLQSQGQAQIGSRPALLTQGNTQTMFDQSETYYMRIMGERATELRAITYGTMLKMTPRVATLDDTPGISLSLYIEDGNQEPNSAGPDRIPTIDRTVIGTAARVDYGQSLLIGGIYRDELGQSQRRVPWLGDTPYLGALFRITADIVHRSVRLFLIELRLINGDVGHYLALDNRRDLRDDLLKIDGLSNQSLSLRKLLGNTRCQALAPARAEQEHLYQAGQGSFPTPCRIGAREGWWVADSTYPKDGAWRAGVERENQRGLGDPLLQQVEPGRQSLARRGLGSTWR